MTIVPKANHRLSAIPIKLPMLFFTELEQNNSQFFGNIKYIEHKTIKIRHNSQTNLEKEEQNWKNQPA